MMYYGCTAVVVGTGREDNSGHAIKFAIRYNLDMCYRFLLLLPLPASFVRYERTNDCLNQGGPENPIPDPNHLPHPTHIVFPISKTNNVVLLCNNFTFCCRIRHIRACRHCQIGVMYVHLSTYFTSAHAFSGCSCHLSILTAHTRDTTPSSLPWLPKRVVKPGNLDNQQLSCRTCPQSVSKLPHDNVTRKFKQPSGPSYIVSLSKLIITNPLLQF